MKFSWRPNKAAKNIRKHKVSFHEAATVFADPDHSEDEERYIIVGMSNRDRLLMVSHMERGDTIRLISARKLTPKERREYEKGNFL